METAKEIAERFCAEKSPDLELAILRHMEHHITQAADAERERCVKIAIRAGRDWASDVGKWIADEIRHPEASE